MTHKLCAIIPVYNNHITIEWVAKNVQQQLSPVIIVDDGSDDGTQEIVEALTERDPDNFHRIRLSKNSGKGAAVQAGLAHAASLGFSSALQVDADGQHNLEDIPKFLGEWNKSPHSLILGAPIFDDTIPAVRKYGRKLTQLMIALESGSFALPDAMCGFRIYPIKPVLKLGTLGNRMNFDPEVMIRAHWAGVPVATVPTCVKYLTPEEGGVSHFRMVHDNVLHVWTHSRLIVQAPVRWILKWAQS